MVYKQAWSIKNYRYVWGVLVAKQEGIAILAVNLVIDLTFSWDPFSLDPSWTLDKSLSHSDMSIALKFELVVAEFGIEERKLWVMSHWVLAWLHSSAPEAESTVVESLQPQLQMEGHPMISVWLDPSLGQKEPAHIHQIHKISSPWSRTTSASYSKLIQPSQILDIELPITQTRWHHQGHEFLPWTHCGADKTNTSRGPSADWCLGRPNTE
jgi:hypothetical protein